ncbi:MAG: type I glyceraldehyde-3-phosphate dehydrogenase [Candidatus Nomurabacteria bacterium]|mgnify:CR=1 FL=1|nr:MAG: type I glyceraldehyde-3-phosphate dehydrogenase [Candidatus Nomurabacteria bacterium]HRV76446.1 type I glyceraldehyde-3-phosphate dehydrogenase [Candidatus Saccharimonadales bacterium]
MKTRIAINGFGRIGRTAFKIAHRRSDIEIVAINDLGDPNALAHLLKHDSTYHNYSWYKTIEAGEKEIIVDGLKIPVYSEKDPNNLPWKKLEVDIVIESTGFFTEPKKAKSHLKAGAKKVIISAPCKGEGAKTVILGVNDGDLRKDDVVISNGSCTTNCVAPVLKILEDAFGVKKSMMTTVHSYTNSQSLQDGAKKDLRESRAASENIVPTSTGASKAVGAAMPETNGLFNGLSIRVPNPVVSLIDLTLITKKKVTKEEVNETLIKAASQARWQGIVTTTDEELVSSDFIGNSHSAIVDLPLTDVVDGDLVKVVAWYDNEWGYSNRLVEICVDANNL